jgi:hypothetical protein
MKYSRNGLISETGDMQELPIDSNYWVQATRSLWLNRGLKLESGALIADIESTELAVGFQFPADMKELYLVVNGFRDWDMDVDNMISIWPMERIREEYKANSDKNFVGFCDFLINSHSIGYFKGRDGIFKCYDDFNTISETFIEAIDLINSGSTLIY